MSTTVGQFNASILLVYLGGVPIAHSTDISFKLDGALVEATSRNSNGWMETIAGLRKWSISVSGLVCYDDTNGFLQLVQGPINKTLFAIKFSTGIAGDPYFSGNARINAISQTGKMESTSTFACSFDGTGALTVGTN